MRKEKGERIKSRERRKKKEEGERGREREKRER